MDHRSQTKRRDFSPEAYRAWMQKMDFTVREASAALGCSTSSAQIWGTRGAPYYVGLACAAITAGLELPEIADENLGEGGRDG